MDNPQFLSIFAVLPLYLSHIAGGKLRLLTERTVDELRDHEPADATTVSCLHSFLLQHQETPGEQHAASPMFEETVLCGVV